MKNFLFFTILLVPVHIGTAWSAKYAVDCPEPCDSNVCKSTLRCKRTVLDDCGCCRVCAAALGETCYRTVSECPYGTYGMECRKTCNCQSGICDRVTGKCLKFPFFQLSASKPPNRRKLISHTENDMASGDGNSVKEEFVKEKVISSPVMKWLNPR
ncbi:endothelial cell-specific molecule 1 isoform X2 [Caretta caretta]|uniref:endothelial cell-specific molecule 1 isoform X2 n=1 Tax=Chelonia mydas TaxID=8469 RepID=UPI001CA8D053|nr:endothelial cell-specific molecule 1 isoform X2 [Chelonia mydas]XP_048706050.1 endothelial cell-specific molecule 1 isoform X2 [Caretta caretta]